MSIFAIFPLKDTEMRGDSGESLFLFYLETQVLSRLYSLGGHVPLLKEYCLLCELMICLEDAEESQR